MMACLGLSTLTACSSDGSGGAGGDGGSSATGSGSDPLDSTRQLCIDTINQFRAEKGAPPLARWKEAEPCVDQQATSDEKSNSPHGAWGTFKDSCNGGGQNECLGQGASGIVSCLQMMWDEGKQAGCSGCDACSDMQGGSCANCDFSGQTSGMVCGHYVNMSALYFTKAACGFSAQGGWAAINFE
ncbi:Hypothetical protein A7982_00833 [Minicystis rosea]|nr:Hypothetical protein A7982_00833 [Minicystis rosea]